MNIRVLFAIKGVALLLALLVHQNLIPMPIWLGERAAVGASEDPVQDGEAANASAAPDQEKGEQGRKTKSLIEDLLFLPKLDRKSVTKDQLGRYLDMLDRKKLRVEEKIAALKVEHERLKRLEGDVEGKIDKLQEELKFFQQTVQKEKEFSNERLTKLIEFYKKVPPKKSAPVFESLDKDLVVALFNGLPQKQVTKILALMNPEKSVEITEYYGRITSAKEYQLLKEVNKELADTFKNCRNPDLIPSPSKPL